MLKKICFALSAILLLVLMPACQVFQPAEPTPVPLPPTPTPDPIKELNICLGDEPQSLYPLGLTSQAGRDVLQAIYDGPIDMINGQPVPVILEELPGLDDSAVQVTPLEVQAGDEVINTAGQPVVLRAGTRVFPSGCRSAGCAINWDGSTPLQLDQWSVIFQLKDGLRWSDGQPLRADDSVYGYRVASDPGTPGDGRAVEVTASYRALDERRVEWVGKAGLVVESFAEYFWMPLPEHVWGGYSGRELLEAEETTRRPLGWGAYMVEEWQAGVEIRLERNPYYWRADENLPVYDRVRFRFIQFTSVDEIISTGADQCDVITPSAATPGIMNKLSEDPLVSDFRIVVKSVPKVEVLALGITPASYDDSYYPYGEDRPDIFGDMRVRQALAHCIDRVDIVISLYPGSALLADSFLHTEHSLMAGLQLAHYAHDPIRGRSLLEEAGWMDYDADPATPRTSYGTARIPAGTALQVNLVTSPASLRADSAARIAADLAECGVGVNVVTLPLEELYAPAPSGAIFGRAFDLALFSWDVGQDFVCEWFMAKEIPSEANNWMGETTGGWNFFGYSSAEFDAACERYNDAGSDGTLRRVEAENMLQQLSTELPVIPLFHLSDAYLIKRDVCGLVYSLESDSVFSLIETVRDDGACE